MASLAWLLAVVKLLAEAVLVLVVLDDAEELLA